ncbi:DEAD/DEAH box helicase [Nakamurella sp. A5-74]|uniref:DNA 3'-5' helicase n=1 Tax=Nakamurella sp. A5-74 TaxID=3158264 RepID=A0AAU8DQB1_9ACTN
MSTPTATPATTLTDDQQVVADRVIGALAGPDARLRDDQLIAITGLLHPGARVLVVQATGWGKSAVYWTATALIRAAGGGPTLVISPLLSLMRDQVVAAERAGLRAATLNSSNNGDWEAIESALIGGDLDVVLVSPERLANPRFGRRVLDSLVGNLGMLVIDEAHAVSDWGHDFRPDYRRVSDTVRGLSPHTPVLATTATANARVTTDVATQLGDQTLVLRGPLARTSLQLAVIDGLTPIQRYGWVVEQLPNLPGSGIVYALTVADAERLAEAITAQHGGAYPVAAYTGQLPGEERERLEEALRRNELKALIATSALGMGYDKPDLGFCVHVGSPPSPVSYYQQVGRAGRAIDRAVVVLLSAHEDAAIWDYFVTASIPDEREVQRLLAVTPVAPAEPASVPALEAESGLRRTKVELMLKQLAVDGVVDRTESGWVRTGRAWNYDAAHYEGVIAVRRREADIMRDYSRGRRCLMQLLQESLDDPTATPCGRCSVCTGELPDDLPRAPDKSVTAGVAGALRTRSHVVEPRKMWPGGAFGSKGRIAPGEMAAEGRALVHADAPEWREVIRAVFAADAPPPEELVTDVVGALSSWRRDWPARPEVVVALPVAGYSALTEGLTAQIAAIGRMDLGHLQIDDAAVAPARTSTGLTSAEEAAVWKDAISVPVPAEVAGRPVLLVVDATSSLWPVTIAAAVLRRAGATLVLPLLVHRRVG